MRHVLVPMGLGFKLKRKKHMSCTKSSRHPQMNAWRMEITTCTGKFSCKTTFLKMYPCTRKLQEPGKKRIKSKKNNRTAKYVQSII